MEAQTILQRQEGTLFCAAIVGVFLSSQLSNSPLYLVLLWSSIAGLLCAYITLRSIKTIPNLLLHMTPPPHLAHKYAKKTSVTHQVLSQCLVCGSEDCKRHPDELPREFLHPWDGLIVPITVDNSITEILEIVMQRFVYSWHRRLAPSAEAFEDELRLAIRHAAASLFRRVRSIDIPHLVTHKLSRAVAAHIHIYLRARQKLPSNATMMAIEKAVIAEYEDHIHTAMRGKTANLRYFRRLAQALIPILLPRELQQSKAMCSFVQELFASKVFVPAMNVAAKPDFINKLLLVMFDPNSRLERMYGPPSKDVSFLFRFAKERKGLVKSFLEIPVPELISADHHLYTFMIFMKSQKNIHLLQVYLNLDELKKKVSGFADNGPEDIIAQVQNLYDTYLLPTSPQYLPLQAKWVDLLGEVLSAPTSASKKCEQLKMNGAFSGLRGYIYNELLVKVFGPKFHKSYEFYALHIKQSGNEAAAASEAGASKKGDKWRQKGKQFKSMRSSSEDQGQTEKGEEALEDEVTPTTVSPLCHAQVIDAETCMEGIRPYTVYVIMSRRLGDTANRVIKRRFKEFVGLDTKLRQFHGDMPHVLPSKRAFRNMDKSVVESRSKELELYLQNLIGLPGVRESQILSTFLSDSSDPSLFLPDTVGDKAGKMIKSVPSRLKREKGQHLEELLQSLLQDVESQSAQTSPQSVAEVTAAVTVNREVVDGYLTEAAEDLSTSEAERPKSWLHSATDVGDELQINSIMDLLIYVAIHVYRVSPWQLTGLQLVKLLGEETVETIAYNFVRRKIELSQQEAKITQLIELLRDNLFFDDNPPRTEEQIKQRMDETLNRLITYPNPLFVNIVGEQRYHDGTSMIFEGLQCKELNKLLFFKLLDIILLELFPELESLESD